MRDPSCPCATHYERLFFCPHPICRVQNIREYAAIDCMSRRKRKASAHRGRTPSQSLIIGVSPSWPPAQSNASFIRPPNRSETVFDFSGLSELLHRNDTTADSTHGVSESSQTVPTSRLECDRQDRVYQCGVLCSAEQIMEAIVAISPQLFSRPIQS